MGFGYLSGYHTLFCPEVSSVDIPDTFISNNFVSFVYRSVHALSKNKLALHKPMKSYLLWKVGGSGLEPLTSCV